VRRALTFCFLAGLYVLGLVHWDWFFDHGNIDFTPHDWPKEYKYYSVLRESLRTRTLPYHVSDGERSHYTNRFLALPETNLSPQILLLPFMDNGRFIVWNVCILYSLGFVGCLLLRRRYQLSLLPFALLFLLFNFNGYITSHLAVGHSMWAGYFLLPFYYLFLLRWVDEPSSPRPALLLALTLFALLLQGSFHIFFWCCLFLGLFVLFNRRYRLQGVLIVAAAALLGMSRILPAAVAFWGDRGHQFLTGYPTLADLLHAFVSLRQNGDQSIGSVYCRLPWHEFDLYLSVPGFALLVILGVWVRLRRDPAVSGVRFAEFDYPLLALAVLSFGDVYGLFASLPIPLVNGERVSSRFLIIVVGLLMLFAAVRLRHLLEAAAPLKRHVGAALVAGSLLLTAYFLVRHNQLWGTAVYTTLVTPDDRREPWELELAVIEQHDPVYVGVLYLSAVGSLLALGAWGWAYRKAPALAPLWARLPDYELRMFRRPGPAPVPG
jgi:hypothetical protein